LVLAAAEAVGVDLEAASVSDQPAAVAAFRAACAVELIHAYSLVHDDMPCMDNDVLRRGKPTVHVKYGEAQALLVGDGLQALAFEFLTPMDGSTDLQVQALQVGLLARASGYQGMAGGQAIDLASVGLPLTENQLRQMHRLKTGALLLCSVQMGSVSAGKPSSQVTDSLTQYAQALGLAFQVIDDILDVTSDSATLGKTAGKDAAADKPTYVSLLGLAPAQKLGTTPCRSFDRPGSQWAESDRHCGLACLGQPSGGSEKLRCWNQFILPQTSENYSATTYPEWLLTSVSVCSTTCRKRAGT
jgi:farnesyl diphosphate synthase